MSTSAAPIGFFSRVFLAFRVFFRVLFGPEFAAEVVLLSSSERPVLPPPSSIPAIPPPPVIRHADHDAALQLLALLQREGRFVDFLEEDVAGFSDAQVGAAARVVHAGCRRAIREHIPLEPIRTEDEDARITLAKGYSAAEVRLTGRVTGEPPFTGALKHRGWKASRVALPMLAEGHDAHVIAPAEVEL